MTEGELEFEAWSRWIHTHKTKPQIAKDLGVPISRVIHILERKEIMYHLNHRPALTGSKAGVEFEALQKAEATQQPVTITRNLAIVGEAHRGPDRKWRVTWCNEKVLDA